MDIDLTTARIELCWLLGTSVQEIGLLCTMKEAFLPKHVRCAYNQHGPFCVCAPTMRPFSQRRGSICAVCVSLDQATRLFLLTCASRTCFAVDEATNDPPRDWCTRRSDQRQSRTAGGKRAAAPPTAHPASTSEATSIPKEGPTSSGAPGQDGSNLERGAFPCPAGDAAAASIVNSSVCSGSTHPRRMRGSRGSRLRQLH